MYYKSMPTCCSAIEIGDFGAADGEEEIPSEELVKEIEEAVVKTNFHGYGFIIAVITELQTEAKTALETTGFHPVCGLIRKEKSGNRLIQPWIKILGEEQ